MPDQSNYKYNLKHFVKATKERSFYPPKNIKYIVYNSAIWKNLLSEVANKNARIVDLGCGGGTLLYNLKKLGYKQLYAFDLKNFIPNGYIKDIKYRQGDVLNTKYPNNYFNAVTCTQVLEHVDDSKLIKEIFRILRPGGIAFISSVYKKKWAWYFYKNATGQRVLEHSHLREYNSKDQFQKLFKKKFQILSFSLKPFLFPVIDPFLRYLYKITNNENVKLLATQNKVFNILRNIRIIIPGYYAIEILVKKPVRKP